MHMTQSYYFDHLHILSRNPKAAAEFYHQIFDAEIIEVFEPHGKQWLDIRINGLSLFIFPVAPEENLPDSLHSRYVGLDHFGFRVDNLNETVAELKRRGVQFAVEPFTTRRGFKIAFIQGPDHVRIELQECP
jgi:lactoylglutathione lyase